VAKREGRGGTFTGGRV
jgi:hypothetical protein